ncbi:MAG: hypothetical protein QW096_13800 [Thermofilaceae archaeon]
MLTKPRRTYGEGRHIESFAEEDATVLGVTILEIFEQSELINKRA